MTATALRAGAAALILLACSDSTAPGTPSVQFGQPLTLAQFESEVVGTARLEVKFTSAAGLTAREIEVEPDDAEEKIVSRIVALDASAGTITLELGTFVASYTPSTRFRTPTNSNVTRSGWEAFVGAELGAGRHPPVEVRRNQPATPQAPTLAQFTAADVRVVDGVEDAKIEVYVDADNFEDVASPPPLAILRIFNLPVQIVTATRLERVLTGAPPTGAVQFEGRIASVDATAGTLTLVDGTVVLVGSGTTFDPDGDVLTLVAAAGALTSGDVVRVEGIGTVQAGTPARTIAATWVKIEVDD